MLQPSQWRVSHSIEGFCSVFTAIPLHGAYSTVSIDQTAMAMRTLWCINHALFKFCNDWLNQAIAFKTFFTSLTCLSVRCSSATNSFLNCTGIITKHSATDVIYSTTIYGSIAIFKFINILFKNYKKY